MIPQAAHNQPLVTLEKSPMITVYTRPAESLLQPSLPLCKMEHR